MKYLAPYLRLMRLHQPVGILLLLWPCWWGITLASSGFPSVKLLVLFALGAIVMRSAGCIINDLADKNIDAQVTRTKNRPLATGEVPPKQAYLLLAILLAIAASILFILNDMAIILGICSLALVVIYPFMKRVTYWPQAFLGLTFNWGALMGWAAVQGSLDMPALALYAAGIFWTLGYDTIYAHQDRESDLRIGVKSTAVKLGRNTKEWLKAFYKAFAVLLVVAGYFADAKNGFFYGWFAIVAHLYWQIRTVRLDEPTDCLKKFRSNGVFGAIVFAVMLAGRI